MTNEEWCDIPGYEGRYQVSDQGRVKSLCRPKRFELILKPCLKPPRRPGAMFYYYVNLTKYAGKAKRFDIHRLVAIAFLNVRPGQLIDHINGDGLDNRLSNLRICTVAQNAHNSRRSLNNTSGFKGVYYRKDEKKWQAQIHVSGHKIPLGRFGTPEAAYAAYCEAAKKYFGEFARFE
jgi:hypothetical protein